MQIDASNFLPGGLWFQNLFMILNDAGFIDVLQTYSGTVHLQLDTLHSGQDEQIKWYKFSVLYTSMKLTKQHALNQIDFRLWW